MGILGESCSSIDGSNVPKWSKSGLADRFKRFFYLEDIAGVSLDIAGVSLDIAGVSLDIAGVS